MAIQLLLLVFASLCIHNDDVDAVKVKYYCMPSSEIGNEFKFTVRLNREGNTSIIGMELVSASQQASDSHTPAATSCRTETEESTDIFALTEDIDVDHLTCGVTRVYETGYLIQLRARGTDDYYYFVCDTSDLLPKRVSVTDFNTTSMTNKRIHTENHYDVKFQVFHDDGSNAPARVVDLGENILLRMIYDPGYYGPESDNWGMEFHTGFIKHNDDFKMTLIIVTEGLGTRVHITGEFANRPIDQWLYVKFGEPVVFDIPWAEYHETDSSDNNWKTERRGIKIESEHDKIGVMVMGMENDPDNNGDMFVVLPDDVLGKEYWPFQSVAGGSAEENTEVVVIATEDTTVVTIKFNDYKRNSLKINGDNIPNGQSTRNVTLDEYELLHIHCDDDCVELHLTSDKPIAVVSGWRNQPHERDDSNSGTSSTQVIPSKYFAEQFVFIESQFGHTGYIIHNDDGQSNFDVDDHDTDGGTYNNPEYLNWDDEGSSEVKFGTPVAVYMHNEGTDDGTPSLVQYPSISQWGVHYLVPVMEGYLYILTFVTTVGDMEHIHVKFHGDLTGTHGDQGTTFGALSNFNTDLADVKKLQEDGGGVANYETYHRSYDYRAIATDPNKFEVSTIEFTAGKSWKPFMLLVEVAKEDPIMQFLPIGLRYPTQLGCTGNLGRPGDNIDNDCDGRVDEEIANGMDDDGDSDVDEDMALQNYTSDFRGIYVTSLIVSDTPNFATSTEVISDGCNVITPSTKEMANIGTFVKNTALDTEFDRLWVLDTSVFNAFRFVDKDFVYFRVTYDFCVADLTLCENSCPSRRKRSLEENGGHVVDLKLEVKGDESEIHIIDTRRADDLSCYDADMEALKYEKCWTSPIMLISSAMLLFIIVFQAVVSCAFMYVRSKYIVKT